MTQLPQPLSANRAFVLQLRAQPEGEALRCEGRIEHLVSGQVARFASQDELWTVITRILTEHPEDAGAP